MTADRPGAPVSTVTNQQGEFEIAVIPGGYTVLVVANGFVEALDASPSARAQPSAADFTLEVAGIQESVSVDATVGYSVPAVSSATKTTTPLRDVPQAVSVVSSALIADQRMSSMADVVRYMPGVGIAQGEGNRDTPILRGNSTTSDFFVDGVRDDVQYFRDVYNVDRVEALKGPNAMIFGRGGVGGVINRVTRQADWGQSREASLQFGSWDNKRFTADVGRSLNDTAALRATTMYENSDSYRNGVGVERYGFNPTAAVPPEPEYDDPRQLRILSRRAHCRPWHLVVQRPSGRDRSEHLLRRSGAEHVRRHRQPGLGARRAPVRAAHHAEKPHDLRQLRQVLPERLPRAVNAAGTTVAISAYNNATTRDNVFNQTDLIVSTQTGRFGHTLLLGSEFGRQSTDNFRETGFFSSLGANVTSFNAPLSDPTISMPLDFRQNATDADNSGVATVAAVYAQDQIALSDRVEAVVGLRFDSFKSDVTNNRTGPISRAAMACSRRGWA